MSSEHKKYRSLIGGLLDRADCASPDISSSVAILARQFYAPRKRDMACIRKFLRYAAGTINYGQSYP